MSIPDFQIVPFEMKYATDFKSLNEEWISRYFKMERMDYLALDHPEEYILNKGGYIAVALKADSVVGVCALIKMDHPLYDYELAKMGVSPSEHGQGIGFQLGKHILAKAREIGASHIFLESNTKLVPAIQLYKKLGFTEISGYSSPYERCDFQMVYSFDTVD